MVTEPGPSEAVPVLRRYITQIRVTWPYFDAASDSPDDAIKAEMNCYRRKGPLTRDQGPVRS
jgi:hypothetical protein